MRPADGYFERALGCVKSHNYPRAQELLIEVLKHDPNFVEAWIISGNLRAAAGDNLAAVVFFQNAVGLKPDASDAWCNMGIAFRQMAMWGMADQAFAKALEINPGFMEPHIERANMKAHLMDLEGSIREYQWALSFGDIDNVHVQLGTVLLGIGDWQQGWLHYERRWRDTVMPPREYRQHKKWAGEDLNGKRIVLYPEQGIGDELLFMRFVTEVKGRYPEADVAYHARGAVHRLAVGKWGPSQARQFGDMTPADYSCPIMDIPMVMGIGPEDISHPPYLRTPFVAKGKFDELLAKLGPGLKVGLCWHAGKRPLQPETKLISEAKSVPLEWLRPLAMPGVHLVSLQLEPDAIPPGMVIHDWMEHVDDLADTAALIDGLDLVISVDTAVAHLAGAMGKPVWNFVRFNAFWPWMDLTSEKTPWYPSMKLLVQPKMWDWITPIQAAAAALAEMVGHENDHRDAGGGPRG